MNWRCIFGHDLFVLETIEVAGRIVSVTNKCIRCPYKETFLPYENRCTSCFEEFKEGEVHRCENSRVRAGTTT